MPWSENTFHTEAVLDFLAAQLDEISVGLRCFEADSTEVI